MKIEPDLILERRLGYTSDQQVAKCHGMAVAFLVCGWLADILQT